MNVSIAILQRSDESGLSWTTLGLGPLTRTRQGRSSPKVRQQLTAELKKAIRRLAPTELHWVLRRSSPRLQRVPLSLNLKGPGGRRRRSGRYPIVVERRPAGAGEELWIAYHPDRQDEWFPWSRLEADALGREAAAYFSRAWAELSDDELTALQSDGRERIRTLGFEAGVRSLIDRLADLKKPPGLRGSSGGREPARVLPTLAVDETERAAEESLPAGMPREPHRSQLQALLCQRRPPSLLLVGPPGVGKTTLLYQGILDRLEWDGYELHQNLDKVRHVWSTSGRRFIAGMSHLGEWEERGMRLVRELRRDGGILYVEDIHTLGRVGRSRDSDRNVAALLQGPVSRGDVVLVGECTPEQLRFLEDDAPSFAAAFTRHHVSEPSTGETLRMLFHEARMLELLHRCVFEPFVYRTIVELGGALFPARAFPGKALELLRELARKRGQPWRHDANPVSEKPLGTADVLELLSERTGLPAPLLKADEPLPPESVVQELAREVMGQEPAVKAMRDVVLRVRGRLTDPGRPYGVYLFAGPTGTGKTELAKTLARYLYGSEARLVRLDMGEYAARDAVPRLVGDRYQPEGVLSRRVREQPFCVLLLDEIEKADPSVFPLLLQLFDEGRLTDAGGRRLDFTHAVVIMTSNLGARAQAPPGLTADAVPASASGVRAAEEFFAPELFNRIDRVVRFEPLARETAERIARKELGRLLSRWGLTERGVFVQCGRTPLETIVREGFDPALGARTVKRYLEDRVGSLLADAVAGSPPAPLRVFHLYVRDGALRLHREGLAEARALDARYALEPLLEARLSELRARLPTAMDDLDALLAGEELQRVSNEITRRVAARAFHTPDEADAIYQLDSLRGRLRRLRGRIGYQLAHPGSDRRLILGLLAEVEFFRRAVRRVHLEAIHSAFVSLGRVGVGGRSEPSRQGRTLLGLLARAYCGGGTWCEGYAARFGEEITDGTPAALAELEAVLEREPEAVVLKLAGLCLLDEIGPETGCHVWRSFGETQIVRVEVSAAPAERSAREELASRRERARRFAAALDSDSGELPDNPEALLPVIREIRYDPPAEGQRALLEVEDYQLGFADSLRTDDLSEALMHLWRLRMSREEPS